MTVAVTVDEGEPVRRRAGRPPQTDEEAERARRHIVRATREVFAEHGFHEMSVAQVLARAGIARPTFYRYFRNLGEPLQVVLDEIGDSAIRMITVAVDATEGDIAKVTAAIEAYLQWSREHRDVMTSIFAGIHDPTSPVSALRTRSLRPIAELLAREIAAAGRPAPAMWRVDVMLNAIEYTCYRVYLDTPADERSLDEARLAMLRVSAALIGNDNDLRLLFRPDEG